MTFCDLCGEAAACAPREIDGKEFDICERCWDPLAERLSGKGRVRKASEELEEYVESEI